MDFQYNTEQLALRDSMRAFLRDAAPLSRVREIAGASGHDAQLWRRLCRELELPGLPVPLQYGGVGGTMSELAIVFEEFGRALTPIPLASHMFAVQALLSMGNEEQRHRLLPGLLTGELVAAFAATGAGVTDPMSATVSATRHGSRIVLDGICSPVLHGHVAGLFVIPARTDDEVGLYVVSAEAAGVEVERLSSFDITRPVARVALRQAEAEPIDAAPGEFERVLDTARVLLAAEMLGGAEACLQLSVEYSCSRKQFDRAIGTFQAVKHMCAEMAIEIDATRVAVMFAAMRAGDPGELAVAAPLVKAQAADTFALCAGTATQVHGGIAFTWEHDLHLYLRRAKTTEALFGSSTQHRALLADRIGL
ncbi:acyl-CoA/acyl-ACP dehydrogenase [Mycobacterium sp. CVI_P3]|uniref:Acyl-CoA/acyl-ACP dehydrogenase n=1 Tax=Mycobacterium pinniadriaticum TaxID=2994102 RepID=A0ABT3SI37_9MYCO|nr:acyl-CoA dehydrogenase family protein [Mycobacterium pinniadriaticum]MCX2932529.1 acyl-CoA/acyl-ACP dehydrogenase [Mycobacterium pinniadriaticum]MCX2939027.1 acyl-CoA/acyl-ACP dehydrogenase [Mycobacterium pinniadriaticum]